MSTSMSSPKEHRPALISIAAALAVIGLVACQAARAPGRGGTEQAKELVFYSTSEDKIDAVFDAFTRETGVKVNLKFYESPEQALEEIRAGAVYDVLTLDSQLVPAAVVEGLLATIDYRNVTNFRNISADFRNLAYDPDNRHAIPYSWGTTGLIVRSDRVVAPVTRWADLWDPRYAGKVTGWLLPRYALGTALKSLGYSANTEDSAKLEEALQHLLALKSHAVWLTGDKESMALLLVDGDAAFGVGWAFDYAVAHGQNKAVTYVLPEEGALLWVDNFVIPANSPNKSTAELFLNFLLRPEITGQLINENHYAMPNDAAAPYVDPAILNDPVIYPASQQLKSAEVLLALSPQGQKLYDEIWDRFMGAARRTKP